MKEQLERNTEYDTSRLSNIKECEYTVNEYIYQIHQSLDQLIGSPWTIQRLCELLSNPTHHHQNVFKYLRAVLKV